MATHNNPLGYALDGSGIYNNSQFIVAEDSIQVVDLQVVSLPLSCLICTPQTPIDQL